MQFYDIYSSSFIRDLQYVLQSLLYVSSLAFADRSCSLLFKSFETQT